VEFFLLSFEAAARFPPFLLLHRILFFFRQKQDTLSPRLFVLFLPPFPAENELSFFFEKDRFFSFPFVFTEGRRRGFCFSFSNELYQSFFSTGRVLLLAFLWRSEVFFLPLVFSPEENSALSSLSSRCGEYRMGVERFPPSSICLDVVSSGGPVLPFFRRRVFR